MLVGVYVALMGVAAFSAADPARWPVLVGVCVAASGLLVELWRRNRLSVRHVLLLGIVFRLFFFPLLPALSDDVFRYVWDGLLQVEGINPYSLLPSSDALAAYHQEPIYGQLNSASYYSIYPPFSQLVFAAGGLFYSHGWTVSYYVIKGLFTLMEVGGLWILSRMVSARMLLLYAWHPLVIVEVAGQGHTEAAMVAFLIVTVWCVRHRWGGWASVALTGAGLVKLYPFVLFPLLWRRFGWRAVWPGVLVAGGLCLPYLAPEVLYNVGASLRLYVQLFEFNAGPYYALKKLMMWGTGQDWSKTIGPALGWLFAGTLPTLYWIDYQWRWAFERAAIFVFGAFFALSTTVHPWYLLGMVALAVYFRPPSWHWLWLGTWSLGTYLFYVGGPYWTFIVLGWGGAALLGVWKHRRSLLQWIQRGRARSKYWRLRPYLSLTQTETDDPLRVLDLGAGEGYVGQEVRRHTGATVVLADVIDINQTELPHVCYDGRTLPFEDDAFDTTILYFVLHHCEDPGRVLDEALRVTRHRILIVESIVTSEVQRRLLRGLDRLANRVRSGGAMVVQESHLQFRTAEAWSSLMQERSVHLNGERRFGSWIHPQVMLVGDLE